MSATVIRHSIPLSTRINAAHAKEILAHDRARVKNVLTGKHPHGPAASHEERKKHHLSRLQVAPGDSVDVTDAGVTYTMPVGVGSPATQYNLLIDTGSSNTWIGALTKYKHTSTSQPTGHTVNVSYGSGSFSGKEYIDQVTLGRSLVIKKQSIGVASKTQGFSDVDGILGVGPVDLTEGTVARTSSVPTVVDNLASQGTIPTQSLGISYNPSDSASVPNGELTFGGVDDTKFTGEVSYVPITSTSPASKYWGIDQSVKYGENGPTILNTTSGIVDTGTTLLLIATDAFNAYRQATGAVLDQDTGLLTITSDKYANLQSLYFNIGGTTYELTPNAQIWPRGLNTTIGGTNDNIYLVVADIGNNLGSGLDFINGFVFLQRFYSVYDTTNSRVGLATTPNTNAEMN